MPTEPTMVAAAARIFSSSVLTNLAKTGNLNEVKALCRTAGILDDSDPVPTVGDAYDAAFNLLKVRGLRNEYVYKAALTHNVLLGIHSFKTASMVSEFRVGFSKADVVIFNGTSTVYEIKSERDNLNRLNGQINDYRKVFARVFVICSPDHVNAVEKLVPDDVGILILSRWNRITTARESQDRAADLCQASILASITNAEAISMLKLCNANIPNVPNTRLRSALKSEFLLIDPSTLHSAMVTTLKRTRSAISLKAALQNLPKSVIPAVMNLRLRRIDRDRLIEVMQRPLCVPPMR